MAGTRLIVPSKEEVLAGPNIQCLEPPEAWVCPAAEFVVDLSKTHIRHGLSEPQHYERHGSYRNRFSEVLVFGALHFNGLLGSDGRIDSQEIDVARERLDIHICYHPGRDMPIPQICRREGGYYVDCGKLTPEKLEGSLYFGTPIEPLNWGMWLLQAIPSAIDFLSADHADRFFAYVGRDWQRQLLNQIGIPDDKLVHHELECTYFCDDLVIKQFSRIDLVPTPMEQEMYARIARNVAGVKKTVADRCLFLSRRSITREMNGTYRALQNEDALIDAFSDRGYEIVEPELLSFQDQIRLFSEARLVAGLGGAALFNVIFSPAPTRVVSIESSTDFVYGHASLFGSLGHPFGIIFGMQDPEDKSPAHKRWSVDVEGVMQAISQYE